MRFTHKDWIVELSGNNVAYWPIASPEEKHFLYHTGGNYSLIKAYLDAVEMTLEEEKELLGQVKQAIGDALESSKFSVQEKQFLMAEQTRLITAIQASTNTPLS
jgi:antitoxin component HigA of HigAB toxin-antitoxin module